MVFGDTGELNANLVTDKTTWTISDELHKFVETLAQNDQLSNEERILLIYDRLCRDYVYDENILSYLQKFDDDKYGLPDWYGRDIDEDWKKNREQHNRRVCYEMSRYLAKSLTELFENDEDVSVCILWDKDLTHYFVGLTGKDYTITLDLDDFYNIKDFTRIKTGLTAEGIAILEDDKGIFKCALDKFNEGKSKHAIRQIEANDISISENEKENQKSNQVKEPDDITFLRNAIEILQEKFSIDSQGLYEYIKEIVDIKLGPDAREKVWKRIGEKSTKEVRYMRCLILNVNNQKYIIDVDRMILRLFNEEELKQEDTEFIPYNVFSREWDELYDGR